MVRDGFWILDGSCVHKGAGSWMVFGRTCLDDFEIPLGRDMNTVEYRHRKLIYLKKFNLQSSGKVL